MTIPPIPGGVPAPDSSAASEPSARPAPILEIRNLRVAFGATEVLHGVDLAVAPGRIHALIGESGSGKSVLARSILGLAGTNARTTGSIRWLGRELTDIRPKDWAALRGAEIGMVVQDAMSAMNPMRTVGEQLIETLAYRHPDFREGPVSGAKAMAAKRSELRGLALDLLQTVGITAPEKRMTAYAHQLSGGMRQRVMIALALAGAPKLLLADEPTTALDVVVQRELLEEMRELVLSRGMSMLLVTHDLHLAHDVADDVSVMYAGHVLEEGPVAKVIGNPAHPYTEGLLDAMPDMESERGTLKPIPGEIPPPEKLGAGCPFASRCARASDGCRASLPPMRALDREGTWTTRCEGAHAAPPCGADTASQAGSDAARYVESEGLEEEALQLGCEAEGSLPKDAAVNADGSEREALAAMAGLEPVRSDFRVIADARIQRHCYYARRGFFGRKKPWDVLQDIDLQIRRGEVMGLVGESGCGKSTLARLMLGLQEPTEGAVRFKDEPFPKPRTPAWQAQRAALQMIWQDPYGCFDPRVPVVDQVAEPLIVHQSLDKAAARARAMEVLAMVGMPAHHAGRIPGVMSGGQLQRAAIARAVALRPVLLACDEPVASLDVSIQAQVLELLNRLKTATNMSMLFVSHNLNVVRYVSDRVTVMYQGRIVESGEVDEVFRRPLHPYTRLLMASTPGTDASAIRHYPKGSMPSPIERPPGCVFAGRCPLACDKCRTEVPMLTDAAEGHAVACFMAGETLKSEEGVPSAAEASASAANAALNLDANATMGV